MKKRIKLNNQDIEYQIKKSSRARRLRIAIRHDASVIVTLPKLIPQFLVERFLREKATWIVKKIEYFKNIKQEPAKKYTRKDYLRDKEKARGIVKERVEYFNQVYKYKYQRISIKNQKTIWGSCSKKGNLNFNYKILYLADKQIDYIIVHELCHLKELNHSKKFWSLVAQVIPDCLKIRKELRNRGLRLQ